MAEQKTEQKEKMVKIRIPRTRKEDPDVYIGINERTWLIKRGVEVEVPECVAELLKDQQEQEERAFAFAESMQN